jgi:proteasome accessory factor B
MSSRRTERLLNLVICLLATQRWLTKEQIRSAVPQYVGCETAEAFDRMFERDKEDLRELGIPITTGTDERVFDDEIGYRIDRAAYALPPVQLDAEELAVLGLASRVWQQASLAGPAARALAKLTSLGVETDDDAMAGLEPRVRTTEPSFGALYAATRDRQPVRFTYRKPEGEAAVRQVEPWAVLSRSGHWYLVGRDRDRDDARVFRLSRIEGEVRTAGRKGSYEVPEDLDPRVMIAPRPRDQRVATVLVAAGRAASLRRRALPVTGIPGPAPRPGWNELTFEVGDAGGFADELAGYGPDVIALSPEDLRDGVRRRLEGALAAQRETVDERDEPAVPAGDPAADPAGEPVGTP